MWRLDGDGKLTKDELLKRFAALDSNKDNAVSREELFRHAFRSEGLPGRSHGPQGKPGPGAGRSKPADAKPGQKTEEKKPEEKKPDEAKPEAKETDAK